MRLKHLLIPSVLAITLAACGSAAATSSNSQTNLTRPVGTSNTTSSSITDSSSQTSSTTSATTYTLSDVQQHRSASDCWMVIDGKVYNVTSYINQHPGGMMITMGCGKDASRMFSTMGKHSGRARALLPQFYVGDLK